MDDLREKISAKPDLYLPQDKPIILKWKGQELKPRTKISSLDFTEAIDPQNDESFLQVYLV